MKRIVLLLAIALIALAAAGVALPEQASARWVQVFKVSGSGIKKTRPFNLRGGEQKVVYTVKAADPALMIFQIYVEQIGGSGFEVIQTQKTGTRTSYMYLGKGRYYLTMNTANCTWVTKVYEKR